MRLFRLAVLAAALLPLSCGSAPGGGDEAFRTEVEGFLSRYNERWRELATQASEAQWASKTRIVEGDDTNMKRTQAAE